MQQEAGQKKYIQIANRIREDIENNVYKEGEMIPTIRELAREYGVNPQTVNKATAHLGSLGYLRSRQGAGSEVIVPEQRVKGGIYMLIDESRSHYLDDLGDPRNYHGKDIYLTYLMRMSQDGRQSRFLVYGKNDTEPNPEVVAATKVVAGFLVQGSLPAVYGSLLSDSDVPTVLINRPIPENLSSGRLASVMIGLDRLSSLFDYLVTLGHRKILFLRSLEFERTIVYEERLSALSRAAERWYGEYSLVIEEFEFDPQAPESVSSFESRIQDGFTGAIGFNDGSALALYSIIQRLGLSVGSDFAVGGFDDISAARLALPPLTTVRVDRGKLVREAFGILDELAGMSAPTRITRTLETELMIRRSALPPRHRGD